MDNLMQKLMISKAIMDKTNGMTKSDIRDINRPSNMMENFDSPQIKYNIPQEFLQEQPSSPQTNQPYLSSLPVENTKPVGVPTVDAIKNSKLPDEIKKLMMEHPISQPTQQNVTLSNDLIERAARLMKENPGSYSSEPTKSKPQTQSTTQPTGNIDYNILQKLINEAVNSALKENGLLVESSEKTNETFSFKVGKHIFEGKVTKIKKLS